jgi:hypothetical protein
MIKRLATFGWMGDDGGARMAWIALHGWAAAYTDPTRAFHATGGAAVFTAPTPGPGQAFRATGGTVFTAPR